MGSKGMIRLSAVFEMLDLCAPEHVRVAKTHHWRITFAGRTYPTLPLGKHGHRRDPEIERGHVRKLIRHFGLEDCAKQILPDL